MNRKKFGLPVLVVAALVVIAGALFLLWQNKTSDFMNSTWRSFTNEKFHFALDYPSEWFVEEPAPRLNTLYSLNIYHPWEIKDEYVNFQMSFESSESPEKDYANQIEKLKTLYAGRKFDSYQNVENVKRGGLEGTRFTVRYIDPTSKGGYEVLSVSDLLFDVSNKTIIHIVVSATGARYQQAAQKVFSSARFL